MGRVYVEYVEGRAYTCRCCGCHLANVDEIVSKHFHSKNGKAYLFNGVVNVSAGPPESRMMTTGWHLVRDIFCVGCMYPVGWKYEEAFDKMQKYKEGKFILERSKLDVGDSSPAFGNSTPARYDVLQAMSLFMDSDSEAMCP